MNEKEGGEGERPSKLRFTEASPRRWAGLTDGKLCAGGMAINVESEWSIGSYFGRHASKPR